MERETRLPVRVDKYMAYKLPEHPRAVIGWNNNYVLAHIVIVEDVLGFPLPPGVEVHHVDGNGRNNEHSNLVVCNDRAYHSLLEQRTRALRESGHANWLRCPYCKHYDDPINLYIKPNGKAYHRSCANEYQNEYARRRRENGFVKKSSGWISP